MAGKGILFISLTILFLGYFLYQPVPTGMTRPWKFRITSLVMDAIGIIANVVEKVSGISFAETFHFLSVVLKRPVYQNYPELEVDNLVWEGVPVRIYRPKSLSGLAPAMVYFHGGGWITFDLETFEGLLIKLAIETKVVVVSVRYRYAHTHPYPVPFEDCLKATAHLLREGERFGVDVKRVAIAGDSAGANLAAAVALRLSQEDPNVMTHLKLQVLVCPCLQALSFNTTSAREHGHMYLTKGQMIFFWSVYLGLDQNQETYSIMARDAHVSPSIKRSVYGSYLSKVRGEVNDNYDLKLASKLDSLVVEPFVSPLMADNLSKVPQAFVLAAEFDMLKDEAILYGERLKQAGVKTDVLVMKGHGHIAGHFASMPFVDNSDLDELFGNVSEYLKKHL